MPSTMENLATLNSFLRTVVAIVVLGGLSLVGWFGYTTYNANEIEANRRARELADANKELEQVSADLTTARAAVETKTQQLREKDQEIDQLNKDIERIKAIMAMLKVDHRLARLTVVDQGKGDDGELYTVVQFVELNDEGQPIDKNREFRIRGDVVYIDTWTVKFEDKYVEQADAERGMALVLFRRIYGEMQQPVEGFPLDEFGLRPQAYARGGKMTDFEKKIWDDFWSIANDKQKASEMGIRTNHGLAVSKKVQQGKSYVVTVRPSGDMSFDLDDKEGTAPAGP